MKRFLAPLLALGLAACSSRTQTLDSQVVSNSKDAGIEVIVDSAYADVIADTSYSDASLPDSLEIKDVYHSDAINGDVYHADADIPEVSIPDVYAAPDAGVLDSASLDASNLDAANLDATSPDAACRVNMEWFNDFQAPFSPNFYRQTFPQIMADFGERVDVVMKHYPLPFHPDAQKAAEASECARDQLAFWGYSGVLFNEGLDEVDGLTVPVLKRYASEGGLDSAVFDACLDGNVKAALVAAQLNDATMRGVLGVPSFFFNQTLIMGAQLYPAFSQAIRTECPELTENPYTRMCVRGLGVYPYPFNLEEGRVTLVGPANHQLALDDIAATVKNPARADPATFNYPASRNWVFSIGGPWENRVSAAMLGLPYPTPREQVPGLSANQGVIALSYIRGSTTSSTGAGGGFGRLTGVLVYGWDDIAVRSAALVLKRAKNFTPNLDCQSEVRVVNTSTIGN